jgi:valyl-tRNA synthetase
MEMVKNRAYNKEGLFKASDQKSAIETLYICLDSILKLFAPIIPFITDYIYRKIYGKTIHLELFPDLSEFASENDDTRLILEFNSALWSAKKEAGISLRNEIASTTLPPALSNYSSDLSAMHKILDWDNVSKDDKEIELTEDTKILIKI